MAQTRIDNTNNKYPGTVTIAELAANTPGIKDVDSDDLDIYTVQDIMNREWSHEIATWEYEYLTAYRATFKDGSEIGISAWAREPEDEPDETPSIYRGC